MFDLQMIGLKIVHELSSLIEHDIIVVDHNGFIIASTDSKRLNEFHEGSLIAMKTKEVTHMTKELKGTLRGVREGVVMPLIIEGVPIGVIGVTGRTVEIEKYGKLVQKITQLFVEDFMKHQEQEREHRLFELFLLDLLNGELEEEVLLQRAEMLKLDPNFYERIVILQVARRFELKEIRDLKSMQLIHPQLKIVQWSFDQLVFLVPKVTRQHLQETLNLFVRKFEKIHKLPIQIGIGSVQPFVQLLHSYRQAANALSADVTKNSIIFEEDLKLELILANLPIDVAETFMRRTIGPIMHDEELILNLEAWLKSNCSLHGIAETLHVHKNTLKYRLKKIEKLLNLDLNERIHQVELTLAIYLHRKFN